MTRLNSHGPLNQCHGNVACFMQHESMRGGMAFTESTHSPVIWVRRNQIPWWRLGMHSICLRREMMSRSSIWPHLVLWRFSPQDKCGNFISPTVLLINYHSVLSPSVFHLYAVSHQQGRTKWQQFHQLAPSSPLTITTEVSDKASILSCSTALRVWFNKTGFMRNIIVCFLLFPANLYVPSFLWMMVDLIIRVHQNIQLMGNVSPPCFQGA